MKKWFAPFTTFILEERTNMGKLLHLTSFSITLAITFLFCNPQNIYAEDGEFDFEPEVVEEVSPVGKFLDEGIKYYKNKEYFKASLMFYKVLEEEDMSADKFKLKAQYELGKTLYRLEIYQGGLIYFDQIVEAGMDHPYYEATLRWLLLISRKLPGETDMLPRISQYGEFFPDRVPDKVRDDMAYLLGRYYFIKGELDLSNKFLRYVTNVSTLYPRAKFLEGIVHVRNYEAEPAVNAFKEVLRAYESSSKDDDLNQIRELTILTMGRTFYSVGQYELAIKYYDKINQGSNHWLKALFEESWAYFQLDNFNKGLGNLHTLNSPFFDDEYFPESVILQAVIFFTNCKYKRVRQALEIFEQTYAPLQEELGRHLSQFGGDTEAIFNFLMKIYSEETEFSPRLSQILNAALTDKTLQGTLHYIEELDREIRYIRKIEPGWSNSMLAKQLMQEIELTKSFAIDNAGDQARERLERIMDELRLLSQQALKIEFETANAEADILDQKILDEQFIEKHEKRIGDLAKVDDEHMYWPFVGEYWRDELGYYLYDITSECGRN